MKRVGAAGYGNDLRERIVAAVQRGDTITAVARQYEVTHRTVVTYLKKVEEGTLEQRLTPSGRPRTVQAEHELGLPRFCIPEETPQSKRGGRWE
ncbi:IS630 transposase-related protein, partial [Deinococcus piscis]|uniref:IS630 transposase-related protein n=1 Tax=Deinococcus piscis TaxID=394230 RepID=UPI001675F66C